MKSTHSNHQKYEQYYSKEGVKDRRSSSQIEKSKQFKQLALSQKRISQMQILNKNMKRKLSLYNNLQSGSKTINKNITQRPHLSPVPEIYESPNKTKRQNKEKFTNYQQNVMANYRKNMEQTHKQKYSNPFEMALVEMIEKEQELMLKRKKDMEFWRNKVRNLQIIYHQLNKTELSNLEDDI